MRPISSTVLRNMIALSVAASTLFWAGSIANKGGHAGWLITLFLWIAMPLVVCLAARSQEIVLGVAVNLCILLSLIGENARTYARFDDFWNVFWDRDIYGFLVSAAIAVALSVIVSLTVSEYRKQQRKAGH